MPGENAGSSTKPDISSGPEFLPKIQKNNNPCFFYSDCVHLTRHMLLARSTEKVTIMNKKLIAVILFTSLFSLAAAADHKGKSYKNRHNSHSQKAHIYDYAKVSSVTPIMETIEHQIPRQCHYQPARRSYHKSATPAILGTIIGAAIGNELGHKKSNKRIGAIAGGILGGSIGADIGRNGRQQTGEYCDHYDIEREQVVVGYDISYRYRGQTYYTTTKQHPGRRIQLKLRFEPVFS